MPPSHTGRVAAALLASVALAACGGARGAGAAVAAPPAPAPASATAAGIAAARADSVRHPYTAADVRFMTAMIGHHAQAIEMSRLVPTHGASEAVRTLARRIINAQRDEIATMQQWLRDRQQPVPMPDVGDAPAASAPASAPADEHAGHAGHSASMPGMLTAAQLRQLGEARGDAFDRLFLTLMIQHHKGAVSMVEELFATDGAAQNETVFKLASDVNVDQITEIARMEQMLVALTFERGSP